MRADPGTGRQGPRLRVLGSLGHAWALFQQRPWRLCGLAAGGLALFMGLGLTAEAVGAGPQRALLVLVSLLAPCLSTGLLLRQGDVLLRAGAADDRNRPQPSEPAPSLTDALRSAVLVPLLQTVLLGSLVLLGIGSWTLIQPLSDFAGLVVLVTVTVALVEQVVTQLFALPMAVVTRRSAVDAIRSSHRVLAAHRLEAALLLLAIVTLNLCGLLLVSVGVLITYPIGVLALLTSFRDWQLRHAPPRQGGEAGPGSGGP
jgi:hypothetical protein